MSTGQVKAKVLCPSKPVADVAAQSVVIPGLMGYMEILHDHAAMVAEIDVGELIVKKTAGDDLRYFVSGGYVQVQDNDVVVLADVIEAAENIDEERLKKAAERADKRLVKPDKEIDIPRAMAAKRRADARRAFLDSLPKN